MTVFLAENLSTIVVSVILIAVVILIIRKMHRDRSAGCSSCGGSCGQCPSAGMCRKH